MELHEPPPLERALIDDSELVRHFSAEGTDLKEFLAMPFERLQESVRLSVQQMQRKHPQKADKIQTLADTMFGPVMLDKPFLEKQSWKEDLAVESASITHNLAHAILYAVRSEESPGLAPDIFRCLALMEAFGARNDGVGLAMREARNALKAELAVIRTLRGAGYQISLPDYTKPQRVLDMDIKSGIDVVARPSPRLIRDEGLPDDMICVDAKSNTDIVGGIDDSWVRVDIPPAGTVMRPIIRRVLDSLYNEGPRRLYYTILTLSASPRYIYGLNLSLPPKEALRRYGAVLDENVKRRIVAKVKGQAPVLATASIR